MRDSIFIPTLLLASHCHASMMYVNPGMVPSGELHYRDRRGSHRRIPNASTEEFMIFSMDDEESDRRQATESASRDRGEPPYKTLAKKCPTSRLDPIDTLSSSSVLRIPSCNSHHWITMMSTCSSSTSLPLLRPSLSFYGELRRSTRCTGQN